MIFPISPPAAIAVLALATSASGGNLVSEEPASTPNAAYPIGNGELGTLASGRTDTETLLLLKSPTLSAANPAEAGAGFSGTKLSSLKLDWLNSDKEVTDYHRTLDLEKGVVSTSFKRGRAGYRQTAFISKAEDLLVLHLRTNMPGSLGFRISLKQGVAKPRIEDRRVLILDGKTDEGSEIQTRVWIYPMESDVSPGDGEISVLGEGEALILVGVATGADAISKLPQRMQSYGFGGDDHPDIHKLWKSLLERHQLAHKKSMPDGPVTLSGYLRSISKP